MSYVLKLRDVIVGRSDLAERDAERRMARGPFRPGLGWELVEPIFALRPGDAAVEPAGQRERYQKARDALALALFAPDGTLVDTARIDIVPDRSSPTGLVLDASVVDRAFWRV